MSKHTPGPWRVAGFDEERIYFEVRSNGFPYENLPAVALAAGRDKTEAEANARLVANAPQMKALLENIEGLADRFANGTRVFSTRTGTVRNPSIKDLKDTLRVFRDDCRVILSEIGGRP